MVRRYTMVTPGSSRKQSVSVSFLSPASYAMMTSRVQDTQWLRLDPPGNNPYPQARLSQAIALRIHERKKPWVTPRWEHSSITSEKPKIRENNIDRMNPRCAHKADIKQKALSISLLRKYISYSTFSNHFQISYLYKVHIYIGFLSQIEYFPNQQQIKSYLYRFRLNKISFQIEYLSNQQISNHFILIQIHFIYVTTQNFY